MICDDILYLLKPVALISITSPQLKDRKHTELDKNHKPSHIIKDLTGIYFINISKHLTVTKMLHWQRHKRRFYKYIKPPCSEQR